LPPDPIRSTTINVIAFGLTLALATFVGPAIAQPKSTGPQLILCGHLFDSESGRMLGATSVRIEGERIAKVSAGRTDASGANVIDLTAYTCLPGLIDAHTHITSQTSAHGSLERYQLNPADYALQGVAYAKRTLLAGFTTIRNLGDTANVSIALRNAIDAGLVDGPRILSAGKAIGSTGGHGDPTNGARRDIEGDPGVLDGIVNSPEDARKAVRQHYKDGADVIKIMPSGGVLDEGRSGDNPQMTFDEIKAVVDAAHDYGFAVAAHAHGKEAMRRAIEAGVDSIEHGTYMDDELFALMKQHGTWYVPTIIAGEFVAEKAKLPDYFSAAVRPKAATIGPQILNTFSKAHQAGVQIAFGTDAGVYLHGDNAHEFELMVKGGMPPAVAIQAATLQAAKLLRLSKDVGQVEAGKYADVIAVASDPLADISALRTVAFVMKGGKVYKQP
jgi:imidazolonepropionase-like amidohydrolase